MPLIKTLSQTLKQDKEKFKVPRSVQQAIPIRKIWPDGIFQVESKFSRTFRFTDINYSIASKADKTEMFLDYSELLNALDSGCTAKITLNNRKINKEEFEQSLLIPMKGDGLDEYRKEYNDILYISQDRSHKNALPYIHEPRTFYQQYALHIHL